MAIHINSAPQLDPTTLFFAISMFAFLTCGIARSTRHAAPQYAEALAAWSYAMLAAGGAFLLYFARGHAPWLLTYSVANGLVVLVPAYGLVGQAKLVCRPYPKRLTVGLVLASWVAAFCVSAFGLPAYLGISMFCAAGAVTLGVAARMLAAEFLARRLPATAFSAIIALLTCLGFSARAIIILSSGSAGLASTAGSSAQVGPLLLGSIFVVGGTMGFMAMVHAHQSQDLLERSQRDGLTGVLTRAAFFEKAKSEQLMGQGQPCAVAMVDIDHFKKINDNFGHRAGDLTLAHASRHIAGLVRVGDLVGRYGGEEFCIALPNCNERQAAAMAERLVSEARLQSVRLPDGRTICYTLSVGYAVREEAVEALDAALDRADQALYRAKRSGRDRATAAEDRGSPAG